MTDINNTTSKSAIRTYHIYALTNPFDNLVFYIGSSVDPANRLSSHIADTSRKDKKARLMREILDAGLRPTLAKIDSVDASSPMIAHYIEQYWITHHRKQGILLYNSNRATPCWDKEPTLEMVSEVKRLAHLPLTDFREQLSLFYLKSVTGVLDFPF